MPKKIKTTNVEVFPPALCAEENYSAYGLVRKTIVVSDGEDGRRLDQILHNRYNDFSRNLWQKRIERKEVWVNQLSARASRKMNKNDVVVFYYPQPPQREVNKEIEIIYQDDFLLAVNKPPNLPVHSSGAYQKNNLLQILADGEKGICSQKLYLIHRLDRETSGLLLLAKDAHSAKFLAKQFFKREVYKEYHALLRGFMAHEKDMRGFIAEQTEFDEYKKFRMQFFLSEQEFLQKQTEKKFSSAQFKKAYTQFFPEEHFLLLQNQREEIITLARIVLHSGRTHQIRATALAMGYPLMGDKLYGGNPQLMQKFVQENLTPSDVDFLQLSHTALHCSLLKCIHPQSKKEITLRSSFSSEISLWLQTHQKYITN